MSNSSGSVSGAEEISKEPQQLEKPWHSYISEDLPRTVVQSTDTAIRSARSLQQNSSNHLRTLQISWAAIFHEFLIAWSGVLEDEEGQKARRPLVVMQIIWKDSIPQVKSQYITFEDAFFSKIKDEITSAREHPFVAGGVAVTTALLLLRGPRRFLFRQTFGRFQSEEAQFVKAEQNVKSLNLSVDLMKKESRKLLERTSLAEKEMKHGYAELKDAGNHIRRLAKDVYKVEGQASDLMDGLREIPGREALRLRAEVASMESLLRQERTAMNKRIIKISELGIPV